MKVNIYILGPIVFDFLVNYSTLKTKIIQIFRKICREALVLFVW